MMVLGIRGEPKNKKNRDVQRSRFKRQNVTQNVSGHNVFKVAVSFPGLMYTPSAGGTQFQEKNLLYNVLNTFTDAPNHALPFEYI